MISYRNFVFLVDGSKLFKIDLTNDGLSDICLFKDFGANVYQLQIIEDQILIATHDSIFNYSLSRIAGHNMISIFE